VGATTPTDRDGKRPRLRVGIALTTDPASTRQVLDEFCAALGRELHLDVSPRGAWHYHHLIEGLQDGEIDLVWLPPVLALRASAAGLIEPVALPVRNGSASYQTALFSRAGSTVRTVDDLQGVRAAWVDRQSAGGYLLIRAHLQSLGVDLDQAFSSDLFLGTYDGVAGAVLDGEVDVGATYVYYDESAPEAVEPKRAGWGRAAVQVIAVSRPIPADLIAVSLRVSEPSRRAIQRSLLGDDGGEVAALAAKLFEAEGLVAPDQEHIEQLTEVLAAMPEAAVRPASLFPPGAAKKG
jgi:phosphonate transport system substrate-binding protein